MANFSDMEDKHLVQLARKHEDDGSRVAWTDIAQKMKYSRKSPQKLQMRLKTLKGTYGKRLGDFPQWFFATVTMPRLQKKRRRPQIERGGSSDIGAALTISNHTDEPPQGDEASWLALFDLEYPSPCAASPCAPLNFDQSPERTEILGVNWMDKFCGSSPDIFPKEPTLDTSQTGHERGSSVERVASSVNYLDAFNALLAGSECTPEESYDALGKIFESVSRADVRQQAGKREWNAGELSAIGVTKLAKACCIHRSDVFVDVGAGIGNVVVQMALETRIGSAIGIEVRRELQQIGSQRVARFASTFPQLRKVTLLEGDIQTHNMSASPVRDCSILFCFNDVFQPEANLRVRELCCQLSRLRVVMISSPFCPRHRTNCTSEFCMLWKLKEQIMVPVTYRNNNVAINLYVRSE